MTRMRVIYIFQRFYRGDETFFEWNYVKPWCRFSPYIIGILLGYILYTTKDRPVKINPVSTIISTKYIF